MPEYRAPGRPRKARPAPSFDALVFEAQTRAVDEMARAATLLDGPAEGTKRASAADEEAAWLGRDPKVLPEHLAQIAQATLAELQPKGLPPALVEQEIRARQSLALYPNRALVWTLGIPDDALDDRVTAAERVARRLGRRTLRQAEGAGWLPVGPDTPIPGEGEVV